MKGAWWVDLKELNKEQRDIIALPLDTSHLITGPPGCGKTNLLLLRANYLAMSAKANVLIVVFTRTLQEFIRTGSQQYAFPDSSVITSRTWQKNLLKEYDYDHVATGTFTEQRQIFAERMSDLVASEQLENLYDAIFLDEAQDYTAAELNVFRKLTPRLFAAADSRQRIYDGKDSIELLEDLTGKHKVLKYHYRCGLAICRAADFLRKGDKTYSPLAPTAQYDEGSRPSTATVVDRADLDRVFDDILESLRLQLSAYPGELLGVISPRREEMEYIGQKLMSSPISASCVMQTSSDYISFSAQSLVCICTVHAAKGLEFRTVHLVGGDKFPSFRDKQRRMAYTAVTRAKTSLSVYRVEPLPGYLEQAINEANPLPDMPDLDAVFKRKQ
jgi:superfamily I DNA/RNA helicase